MIRTEVKTVTMSLAGFVVLLEGIDDDRVLPIHIGPPEAQSILLYLNDVPVGRPLTHDLFRNVLQTLTARVDRIVVSDLRDDTFFATMSLITGSDTLQVDCRPSDAIALALRCAAPIYVEDFVMARAGIHLSEGEEADEAVEKEADKPESSPANTGEAPVGQSRLQRLKADLKKAIEDERYEDAAELRDRIGKTGKATT